VGFPGVGFPRMGLPGASARAGFLCTGLRLQEPAAVFADGLVRCRGAVPTPLGRVRRTARPPSALPAARSRTSIVGMAFARTRGGHAALDRQPNGRRR